MPASPRTPGASLPTRLLALVLTAFVTVTTVVATALPASAATRDQKIRHARSIALHQTGDPYRYGAAGPHAFDCSGLTYYAFHRVGFKHVPRSSSAQARHARRIPKRALRPGDLMFFTRGSGVYHVGIFLRWRGGRAEMVHSPRPGQRVRVERTWTSRWFAGTLRGL
jgi:cell wall-associated NlpC family hydrolase